MENLAPVARISLTFRLCFKSIKRKGIQLMFYGFPKQENTMRALQKSLDDCKINPPVQVSRVTQIKDRSLKTKSFCGESLCRSLPRCLCPCWEWPVGDEAVELEEIWISLPVWVRKRPGDTVQEESWTGLESTGTIGHNNRRFKSILCIFDYVFEVIVSTPDMSEHFCESTIRASNTSKSVVFTWMMLLTVPSWLVTIGWGEEHVNVAFLICLKHTNRWCQVMSHLPPLGHVSTAHPQRTYTGAHPQATPQWPQSCFDYWITMLHIFKMIVYTKMIFTLVISNRYDFLLVLLERNCWQNGL